MRNKGFLIKEATKENLQNEKKFIEYSGDISEKEKYKHVVKLYF